MPEEIHHIEYRLQPNQFEIRGDELVIKDAETIRRITEQLSAHSVRLGPAEQDVDVNVGPVGTPPDTGVGVTVGAHF